MQISPDSCRDASVEPDEPGRQHAGWVALVARAAASTSPADVVRHPSCRLRVGPSGRAGGDPASPRRAQGAGEGAGLDVGDPRLTVLRPPYWLIGLRSAIAVARVQGVAGCGALGVWSTAGR